MSADAGRQVVPLPGPLHVDPTGEVANLVTARRMLGEALADVERGTWDDRIVAWLTGKDIAVIATVASLLRRAWEAGLAAGRSETVDEQPAVQALHAQVEELGHRLDDATAERAAFGQAIADVVAVVEAAKAEAGPGERWHSCVECEFSVAGWDVQAVEAHQADTGHTVESVAEASPLADLLTAIEQAIGGVR